MGVRCTGWAVVAAVLVAGIAFLPAAGRAEDGERPSIQKRYATKRAHIYLHAGFTSHLRDDFYDVWGGAATLGYYITEPLAVEVSAVLLHSTLNHTAQKLRDTEGLLPDAQAQNLVLTLGARYSMGYAKALMFERLLAHFEPHLLLHLGAAHAETRWLPTLKMGLGALVHLPIGLQVQLDLSVTTQLEERRRGWVPSVGFMPLLSVGWAFDLTQLPGIE